MKAESSDLQQKDSILIRSESDARAGNLLCAILVTGMDIWLTIESLEKGIEIERGISYVVAGALCMLLLWLIAFCMICLCITTEKKVLMDREGCTISLWWWKRQYSWDYYKVKQLEHYYDGYRCEPMTPYKEGAVFSAYPVRRSKKHNILDYRTNTTIHIFSMVFVAFKVEITKKEKNIKGMVWGVCEVDKEEFLQKMEEWGVELEQPEQN